jgi:hypothetical protein
VSNRTGYRPSPNGLVLVYLRGSVAR